MAEKNRNKQEIYDNAAAQWWSDDLRWVRTLKNLVPARLKFFDRHIDWAGKTVLDLGCAGGFMAEAIAGRGAQVLRPGTVEVCVLEPVDTSRWTVDGIDHHVEEVRDLFVHTLANFPTKEKETVT